ncbi:MAG TPA: hypothetical protein VFU22_19760, partial [Roseiflexaceae bacterium]|nr:hypothetical protein [Roseiflexaceae bacterium]
MLAQTTLDPQLAAIDWATIAELASAALAQPANLLEWNVEAVNHGMGSATSGMYRFTGESLVDSHPTPWSIMLKVMRLDASSNNPATRDVSHPLYWEREALVYQSDLLRELPGGITAPRCLAVMRRPDDTLWLWLEEARDRYGPQWPLEQFASAARCLGRFNGAYLAGWPIPADPWLCGPASLRGILEHFAGLQEVIRDP